MAALAMGVLLVQRANAQGFALSAAASAGSLPVNGSVTFTLNLTNLTGALLVDATVSNLLPSTVQIQAARILRADANSASIITNGSIVRFDFFQFQNTGSAQMIVTAQPLAPGVFTNTVSVAAIGVTNTAMTNVVVQATNVPTAVATLAVSFTPPPQTVYARDWMTYAVTVTNAGPEAATGAMLTNTLPAEVEFQAASPPPTAEGSGNVVFSLGTLSAGAARTVFLTVEPTQAGAFSFAATAAAADATNATASLSVNVTNFLSTNLVAAIASPQRYNPQNNLVEQLVTVSNAGPSEVPAARVLISGLAVSNVLFNAAGTNGGHPFVVYGLPLEAGQDAELLLQFWAANYFALSNSQLQAVGVAPPNLAPMANLVSNVPVRSVTRLTATNLLVPGSLLLWFPSVPGRTYTVLYSTNLSSTNWLAAQPAVQAFANFTEWIDYGPPGTLARPADTPARFYRVFLNAPDP
jgi:uncharacterized repeat protein (TIGR01451 family)